MGHGLDFKCIIPPIISEFCSWSRSQTGFVVAILNLTLTPYKALRKCSTYKFEILLDSYRALYKLSKFTPKPAWDLDWEYNLEILKLKFYFNYFLQWLWRLILIWDRNSLYFNFYCVLWVPCVLSRVYVQSSYALCREFNLEHCCLMIQYCCRKYYVKCWKLLHK